MILDKDRQNAGRFQMNWKKTYNPIQEIVTTKNKMTDNVHISKRNKKTDGDPPCKSCDADGSG